MSTVSGLELGEIADRELPVLGVEVRDGAEKIRLERSTWRMESGTTEVTAPLLVHAPYGREAGPPAVEVEPWLGRGVSRDAWSDASFYRGRDVVVAGSGCRAAEQALLVAASGVRHVLLACEARPRFRDLDERVRSHPGITVRTNATIVGLRASDHRHVEGIVIETAEGERSEHACSCVFLASGPVAHVDAFASAATVEQGLAERRLFRAGIAAGVAHGDFAAQAADAERVVEDVVRRLREHPSGS